MAALPAGPLILGERPAAHLPLDDPWSAGLSVASRFDDPPLLPCPVTLTALAARIERATEETVQLAEADLPLALRTRTALALLQRRADRRGKRLVLVSASRELRRIAHSAGLESTVPAGIAVPGDISRPLVVAPVKASPSDLSEPWVTAVRRAARTSAATQFQAAIDACRVLATQAVVRWTAPGRERLHTIALPSVRLPRAGLTQALALGTGVGALLLVVAFAAVPAALVVITPAPEVVTLEVSVVIDPATKKPDLAHGKLPGRVINKEVSETAQAPTTGRKTAPDARATGEVVLINRGSKAVSVPKGTVLLAGTTKFATQSEITVPATAFSGPQQRFGMSRVAIVAAGGGQSSNLDRYAIGKIDGPLAGTLDVQNDAPTRGGSDRTIAFVTADDRAKLQDSLYRTLAQRLAQQIKGQLPALDKESAVAWSGQNPAVVEATFNKNVDEEAQTLSLTMKLRYGATIFSNTGYNDLAQQFAGAKIGAVKPGFALAAGGPLDVQPPDVQGVENGVVRVTARVKGTAAPRLDRRAVASTVANQPVDRAQATLGALPGVAAAEVRAWPAWLGRLPWLSWRIAVQVRPATA